jgi:hypothetical protein
MSIEVLDNNITLFLIFYYNVLSLDYRAAEVIIR